MSDPRELSGNEYRVLATIRRIGSACGLDIARALEAATGREIANGAVYTTLYRMEEKGLVTAKWQQSEPQRGGRSKKLYALKRAGTAALERADAEMQALAKTA